ncbi:acyl-protein thioesterase [Colletotrichum orchidophilum]|uniref:Acyl-protein thioesterase n=1 Tax=Colletotrichum orchidophilum TaxID=1209926 RepID=A0A1G4BG27_9PEZI|nr:acyl-protein thioesterase [Colletotrichum orchidophilum]OHF00263.1 acyl-protein thioesterase [Colletotrichum orchidophilum]
MTEAVNKEEAPGIRPEPRLPLHAFPPPMIIAPQKQPHRHTIILLHGRGSSARIFAPALLSVLLDNPIAPPGRKTFQDLLPHARFVFPTAPRSRATVYRRSIINQWYDGSGDWEETLLGNARETVLFIHSLIEDEAVQVGGTDRVVLGGFSQGCAAALLCLLLWRSKPIGGLLGMCGMLPMAGVMSEVMMERSRQVDERHQNPPEYSDDDLFEHPHDHSTTSWDGVQAKHNPVEQALRLLGEEIGLSVPKLATRLSLQETPVFLGHGTADDNVSLQDGQEASRVLQTMGFDIDFKTYDGLGHCYSKDMLKDMIEFLRNRAPGS